MTSSRPEARPATRALREILTVSKEFEGHLGEQLAVNPTDLEAMEHLIASGPLAPAELARRLGITRPAVTAVVDRLAAVGHASRSDNPADRRGVVVTASPTSTARAMGILLPMIFDVDAVLDEFDPAEQDVIARYLELVLAAYRGHLPTP
ncbi:MarR family transcriptional regulator [soil metagenome]